MDYLSEVDEFISATNSDHSAMLTELREIISQVVPNVEEHYKWSRPVYGCPKDFCYLASTKKHVTLGFYNPSHINDPNKLLEGTGKMMRHIKLTRIEDIEKPLFTKMLRQAAEIEE